METLNPACPRNAFQFTVWITLLYQWKNQIQTFIPLKFFLSGGILDRVADIAQMAFSASFQEYMLTKNAQFINKKPGQSWSCISKISISLLS